MPKHPLKTQLKQNTRRAHFHIKTNRIISSVHSFRKLMKNNNNKKNREFMCQKLISQFLFKRLKSSRDFTISHRFHFETFRFAKESSSSVFFFLKQSSTSNWEKKLCFGLALVTHILHVCAKYSKCPECMLLSILIRESLQLSKIC